MGKPGVNIDPGGHRRCFGKERGCNAAPLLGAVRKVVLAVLLVFGLVQSLAAPAESVTPARLHQKLEEVNRFVRDHTGYKALSLPKVVFLTPDRMQAMRYGSNWRSKGYPETFALAKKGVIFLSTNFQIGRDDYILAHELTHYQQFQSGKQWQCSAAMEPEAYRVQNLWVQATGRGQKADLLAPLALSDCGQNP
jgi:Domain of unknown function (DUF6647)